jgi:hypothetical protein
MKKLATLLMIAVLGVCTAQTKFETGMQKALGLWGEDKIVEASALFERIAAAVPNEWLPNYYIALINSTAAFKTKDKESIEALLSKAQTALDVELGKNPNNAELYVVQALIHTAWIVYDPMTNGMVYSTKAMEAYYKAQVLDPSNPRVILGKAEFEMGSARYFGKSIKPMCEEVNRAIDLFKTEKPQTPLHPKWGLDRALTIQNECK